jgi:copper chaperone NosL
MNLLREKTLPSDIAPRGARARARSVDRRAFLTLCAALVVACRKDERCKQCGMRIDRQSAWRAELVGEDGKTTSFDTPRCALASWRSGKTSAKALRVQEYYDRQWRDAREVRFVVGGDVVGPMGPDLVPVDPPRATKFIQDHGADRALSVDEVTVAVVSNLQ